MRAASPSAAAPQAGRARRSMSVLKAGRRTCANIPWSILWMPSSATTGCQNTCPVSSRAFARRSLAFSTIKGSRRWC